MKTMKKLFALIMALAMVMALAVTVSATTDGDTEPTTTATTGTITLKNATKGYEYKAYKILDATYKTTGEGDAATTSVAYTTKTPDLFKGDDSIWVVSSIADENGNYNVQLAENKTATDVNAWIKANLSNFTGVAPTTGADANGIAQDATLTWANVGFGYYYITSGLGANVTVDSNTPDVEVYDKNDSTTTDPVKTIVSVDGTAVKDLTETDAHVGSVVGFKIVANTNNWINKDTIRREWTVTDTPTSMDINLDSLVVKFNGTPLEANQYTATIGQAGKLTINAPMVDANGNSIFPANLGTVPGQIPIEITYNATITKDAGSTPAKNEIPGSNIVIKTYKFELAKVDGNNAALLGAKFEVYNGETLLTFTKNDAGEYVYDPAGTITQIDLTAVANAIITGLDKWDLVVKEVVVPEGYNQAPDTNVSKDSLTLVGAEGNPFKLDIVNNAGAELPETGGIGTTIFTVVGATLMIGAAVLFITKKRTVVD